MPRGGDQVIPRPPGTRPGAPAPWAELAPERRRPTVDDVRRALAGRPPARRSPLEGTGVRASAVLCALWDEDGVAQVALTRRARHLRAMVMWEHSLLNLPAEPPRFARKEHATRYRTLQAIARQYRAHPERFGLVHIWRPKDFLSITPVAGGASIRVREPQPAG